MRALRIDVPRSRFVVSHPFRKGAKWMGHGAFLIDPELKTTWVEAGLPVRQPAVERLALARLPGPARRRERALRQWEREPEQPRAGLLRAPQEREFRGPRREQAVLGAWVRRAGRACHSGAWLRDACQASCRGAAAEPAGRKFRPIRRQR